MPYNKEWTKNNPEKIRKIKIRNDLLSRLKKYKILPKEFPYSKEHENYMDLLKAGMYEPLNNLIDLKKKELEYQTFILKEKKKLESVYVYKPRAKKDYTTQRISKLINIGILPNDLSSLTSVQQTIYNEALSPDIVLTDIIWRNLSLANEQTIRKYIFQKIKSNRNTPRSKNFGILSDINPDDIILNEYCPFFNVKLDYNRSTENIKITDYMYSVDRIDNSKGYVKGNVWTISRLANTIKSDSTLSELKTFCQNIIKLHGNKGNN